MKADFFLSDSLFLRLIYLINQRYSYMEDVAAFKFLNKLPITDPKSETIVFSRSKEKAKKYFLDENKILILFNVFIRQAKSVQSKHIKMWSNGSKSPNKTQYDLISEIFPILLSIGDQIIEQISIIKKEIEINFPVNTLNADLVRIISAKFVTKSMKQEIIYNLLEILS